MQLLVAEDLREDLAELEEGGGEVDAVVMGDLGEGFTYEVLNEAFRKVRAGAELIALQKNRYWETAEGLSLDAGPFVAAVEYAADREAVVVGKPSEAFFELALSDLGVKPAAAAMVGDDVEADVAAHSTPGSGASSCGPASTARTTSAPPGSSRPRPWTRSPTYPIWSTDCRRKVGIHLRAALL